MDHTTDARESEGAHVRLPGLLRRPRLLPLSVFGVQGSGCGVRGIARTRLETIIMMTTTLRFDGNGTKSSILGL